VDDEIVITVRLRLDSPEVRDQRGPTMARHLPDRIIEVLDDDGWLGSGRREVGIHLAGVEVALPDFRPLATGYLPVATRATVLAKTGEDAS
jgi:hypothetical protein